MKLEETHYDAFISYRHTEPDMFVAQTLHKELEAFRLPKNLIKKLEAGGVPKTRIRRVFRDQDELPISSNLKDPILQALKNTDFLVVICTPRLPQSLWCRTEIEQFIALHGRERVLAVLAEGEPEEAFPEQLRYIEENGQRKEVEPLAADVRGKTRREIRKKIKAETLRLAAPMFGCGYDDLRQRHRERRLKRIAAATAGAAAVCFVFGAVSTVMAMQIQRQSRQIEEQSLKIEEQYTQALKANAITQAAEALRILETGDRLKAVKTALAVFPGSQAGAQPYTPQAQYALTQSLGVYQDGTRVLPKHMLHHDAAVDFMKLSPGGTRLLTADGYGTLYIWDALSGKLLYQTDELIKVNLCADTAGFLDEDRVYYPAVTGLGIYDLAKQETVLKELPDSFSCAAVSADGSRYALLADERVTVYDAKTYRPVCGYTLPETLRWQYMLALDGRGEKLAVMWKTQGEDWQNNAFIGVINAQDGTLAAEYAMGEQSVQQLAFSNGRLLAAANVLNGADSTGTVYCWDMRESGNLLWKSGGKAVESFVPYAAAEENRILTVTYDTVKMLSGTTGETLGEAVYGTQVVDATPSPDNSFAGVRLRNGEYHYLDLTDMDDFNMSSNGSFKAVPENLKDAAMGDGFMASYDHLANDIVIHTTAAGSKVKSLMEAEGYISDILVKKDESVVILQASEGLTALNPIKNEILWSMQAPQPIITAAYLGSAQDEVAVALPHTLLRLDASTGEIKEERQLDGLDLTVLKFSSDGTRFALANVYDISIYDTRTCELLEKDGQLEEIGLFNLYGIDEELKSYAVACPGEKELKLLRVGEKGIVRTIPLNAASVQYITVCAKANRLYVTYLDGKAEAYVLSTGALLKTYTDLPFELRDARYMEGKQVLLLGSGGACVTDKSGEPLALLGSPCAALAKNGVYLTASNGTLLAFPIYDGAMLREEAQALPGAAAE